MAGRPKRRARIARENPYIDPSLAFAERELVAAQVMGAARAIPGYGPEFLVDSIHRHGRVDRPEGLLLSISFALSPNFTGGPDRSARAGALLAEIESRLPPDLVTHGGLTSGLVLREDGDVLPSIRWSHKHAGHGPPTEKRGPFFG
jgi:hypothetical protein